MSKNKIYSGEELQNFANEAFEQFPLTKKVFATSDGNVFLEENRAEIHAGIEGKIFPFEREPAIKSEELKVPSALEIVKAIKAALTVESLEEYKTDSRASVVKALEEKTKLLIGDTSNQKDQK